MRISFVAVCLAISAQAVNLQTSEPDVPQKLVQAEGKTLVEGEADNEGFFDWLTTPTWTCGRPSPQDYTGPYCQKPPASTLPPPPPQNPPQQPQPAATPSDNTSKLQKAVTKTIMQNKVANALQSQKKKDDKAKQVKKNIKKTEKAIASGSG